MMTIEQKICAKQNRLNNLIGRGDRNIKCPGVVRKLKREIRNLKKRSAVESFYSTVYEVCCK